MYNLEKEIYLGNSKNVYNKSEGISIIETEYQNKVYEGWHSHENAHITLFLKGGTIEKRKKENFSVSPGTVLFYHSDELHLNQNTLFPSKNINIEISKNHLNEFDITEELLKIGTANTVKTKLLILKIYNECLIGDAFSKDSIHMLFTDLASNKNYLDQFSKCPNWVYPLYELLNDCWNENPSLNELSKILNINPISISKHFPKYFGCTLGEYVRRLKINRSLTLIQKPSASLTEISFECGFADQSHFIRTFKQQTGFLPKKFQNL
ncbi:helix-turn-helix transcriptional regulator [Flavobacterium sp. LS1R49]|uniref:Helix-turn-helix transcriptional regulator n=1 Tax=Flavobacterium shii TaxID=2987687 RepID=A0A9X2ZCR1_9FLAO|nr:AraC family transcriptional regulator [Flavobacterium shii]MCV9928689.1 helix-turn-helix transcriptional regulator [Flavobacterium shii]